jgi:hypothetical protein
MTNSADEEIEKLRKIWLTFDFYTCDAIFKTIERANQIL